MAVVDNKDKLLKKKKEKKDKEKKSKKIKQKMKESENGKNNSTKNDGEVKKDKSEKKERSSLNNNILEEDSNNRNAKEVRSTKDSVSIDIPQSDNVYSGATKMVQNIYTKLKSQWVTKDIAASLGRDVELKLILRDIVHFSIFLTIVSIGCFGNMSAYNFYMTRALKLTFDAEKQESTANAEEFWKYMEETFIDALYTETWYGKRGVPITDPDDKKILHENLLVGAPRIKQVKVRNDSCIIHKYFAFAFFNCFGEYTPANEDKEPFGLQHGTTWVYQSAAETGSPKSTGKISTYGGGGYYSDLSLYKYEAQKMIQDLKQNLWVRRSTRCVTVEFTVYNGNLNLFCIIGFMFEFPPTGGVIASNTFTTVKIIRYSTIQDYILLSCEILILFYVIYFTVEEVRDMSYLHWNYFTQFWSYIDCSIIVTGYLIFTLSTYRMITLVKHMYFYQANPEKYLHFEYLGDLLVIFNNASATLLFLVYTKIFKFINFNRTMGQLNITLSKCKYDVAGFSIMFAIIFIAFAALGYLLFGTEAEDFNEFGHAMLTLLRTILGDFDYKQIERANPVMAPVYFLMFIFLVFFVLLNMFLAIINDTYTDVKTEIALGPQELQMSEVVTKGYSNLLKKLGCKGRLKKLKEKKNELTITFDEIRTALKNCGFTDIEIEMFFARYNLDPRAKAGELNVKKLVDELEGKYKTPEDDDEDVDPVVTINDFAEQQVRLGDIEQTVGKLSASLQALLEKLDKLESVRRSRKV